MVAFFPPPAEVNTATLRVLARPAFGARTNPYTRRIYSAMPPHILVAEWTFLRALTQRWDIVHVHWPETVFDHTLAEALVTTRLLLAGVDAARARGARLVWTIHNLRAHGRRHPKSEAAFRQQFLRRVDGIIALTQAGLDAARANYRCLADVPAAVVAHPHYRGVYEDRFCRADARDQLGLPQDAPVLAFVGRIAAYKGVSELVSAFEALQDDNARLLIAGAPFSREDRAAVLKLPQRDARIHIFPNFVPDKQLQLYLRACNLVVLPFLDILNSGSALLALSFDRPVLAPAQGAIVELAKQVGNNWVQTYEGSLTAQILAGALSRVASHEDRSDGQQLNCLDPTSVALETLASYRRFIASDKRMAELR